MTDLQFQAFDVNCSMRFYCDAVSKLFEKSGNVSKYFSSKSQSSSPMMLTDQGSWFNCPMLLRVNIILAILVLEFGCVSGELLRNWKIFHYSLLV